MILYSGVPLPSKIKEIILLKDIPLEPIDKDKILIPKRITLRADIQISQRINFCFIITLNTGAPVKDVKSPPFLPKPQQSLLE